MQRWVLILLLVVYPFQVALAMADGCCVTTPVGVTHHSAEQGTSVAAASVAVAADELPTLADPHCAACTFAHHFCLPSEALVLPDAPYLPYGIAFVSVFPTSPPAVRLERPKWIAAAR